MDYNYCSVIAKKEIIKSVLNFLNSKSLKATLITRVDGEDLVVNGNSMISYHGKSFPDLEEKYPRKTFTLCVNGRMANYAAQGNWDLASSFKAGISLQMGFSLRDRDRVKLKKQKNIAALLAELQSSGTFDDMQNDDGVALHTHCVRIESEKDFKRVRHLSELLEKLSVALVDKDVAHYIAWFEDSFSSSSGELDENLLYPAVYVDAFWVEDGVDRQLHVTHTEIFCE